MRISGWSSDVGSSDLGITTSRDASGDLPDQVLTWRGEIAGGKLFGPRLLTSGAKIEGIAPLWKGTIEVGSEADVDAALDRMKNRRSEERRVGKECASTCRSGWSPYH